jgi:MFS family permease
LSQINSIALTGDDIAPEMFSTLSLILSLGAILGAYLGFPISDSRGRRFGFLVADMISVLGVILVRFTQTCIGWKIRNETVAILIFARFVTGLSIGIFSYLVPLYCILYIVREIVPTEISTSMISLHVIVIALGHFISYVATLLFIDSSMIYISFCIPLLAVGIQAFILLFIYEFETPSYLWIKNRREEVIYT